jgi:hypothetical protein
MQEENGQNVVKYIIFLALLMLPRYEVSGMQGS